MFYFGVTSDTWDSFVSTFKSIANQDGFKNPVINIVGERVDFVVLDTGLCCPDFWVHDDLDLVCKDIQSLGIVPTAIKHYQLLTKCISDYESA